jgi:hypothetical protein
MYATKLMKRIIRGFHVDELCGINVRFVRTQRLDRNPKRKRGWENDHCLAASLTLRVTIREPAVVSRLRLRNCHADVHPGFLTAAQARLLNKSETYAALTAWDNLLGARAIIGAKKSWIKLPSRAEYKGRSQSTPGVKETKWRSTG